jgi:hypothetical protein
MTTYDGTTPLQPVIAELLGYSMKSQNLIADAIQQAKDALGIDTGLDIIGRPKRVRNPADMLRVWQWHVDRLNQQPVKDCVQTEWVEPKQIEHVEIILQSNNEPVEIYSQDALIRIAFYTVKQDIKTRQVIALDGFYINALILATGINKKGVTGWIQQSVNSWPEFDSNKPITRQVKQLLIKALTDRISQAG